MSRHAIVIALALACAAPAAWAGEARCRLENGVVVAPAAFDGIAGDYLVDLSASRSVLHLTAAQEADVQGPAATGVLKLAGERIPATLAVASLDARSWDFPTTIDGLIGADVLAGYVVDLSYSPCRIGLWRRGAPSIGEADSLPVRMIGGVPTVRASVSDGRSAMAGDFAIDTGSWGVRLATSAANLSRTPAVASDAFSRIAPPARLAALGVADRTFVGLPAALAGDLPAGVLGGVGDVVWSRFRLRLDLRRGRLQLAPPLSGRRRARCGGSWRRGCRRTAADRP